MNKPAMRVEQRKILFTQIDEWIDELNGLDLGDATDCTDEMLTAVDELERISGEINFWIKRTLDCCGGE